MYKKKKKSKKERKVIKKKNNNNKRIVKIRFRSNYDFEVLYSGLSMHTATTGIFDYRKIKSS